jgi:hypothetical protein
MHVSNKRHSVTKLLIQLHTSSIHSVHLMKYLMEIQLKLLTVLCIESYIWYVYRINKKMFGKHKGDDKMGFTTYKNTANPHVTIHLEGCNQIKKHGGQHRYGQGSYEYHETYADAKAFARSTRLPVRDCSFCKPR